MSKADPYAGYQANRDIDAAIDAYGIRDIVESYCYGLNKPRLLDIGCNEGMYCLSLAPLCSEVIGVEPVKETVAPAIRSAPDNCLFVERPFRCSMVRGEKFDVILLLAVISHLEPPALLARCLASALKPGGTIVVLTHSNGCDPTTEAKTLRFEMELQRFLSLASEELIDCRKLERNDKQGIEGLHRRLLVFESDNEMLYNGITWEFHAAGGTSKVFLSGGRILKWFEVEFERDNIRVQLDRIVKEEASYLTAANGRAGLPLLAEQGTRHIIMSYRGEQPSVASWPSDWHSQICRMEEELAALGRPLGDVALENILVDNGKLSLIDPIVIPGVHKPDGRGFAERVAHLVKTDLETQPLMRSKATSLEMFK